MLSVALSLVLRPVGVTHHRVLWSPDFPLPGTPVRDRPADSQLRAPYTGAAARRLPSGMRSRKDQAPPCQGQPARGRMARMAAERFTNARVHEWLTPDLEAVTKAMHATRLQVNSAALWWFCRHMTAEERADVLGEYVKVQALGGTEPPAKEAARTR